MTVLGDDEESSEWDLALADALRPRPAFTASDPLKRRRTPRSTATTLQHHLQEVAVLLLNATLASVPRMTRSKGHPVGSVREEGETVTSFA